MQAVKKFLKAAKKFSKTLLSTEPAIFKGLVSGGVALGVVWGFDYAPLGEQLNKTIDIVFTAIVPVLTGLWIRPSVFAPATVDAIVELDEIEIEGLRDRLKSHGEGI